MSAFARISLVEVRLLGRDVATLFFMLGMPLLFIVVNGAIGGPMDRAIPTLFTIGSAIGGVAALPAYLVAYRERKVLKRFAVTPVSPVVVFAGQVAAHLVVSVLIMVMLIVVSVSAFGVTLSVHSLWVIPALVLTVLMVCAIGFLVASLVSTTRAAEGASLVVLFGMLFLGGLLVPFEFMKNATWLARVAEFVPLRQAATAVGQGWAGAPDWFPLVVLAGIIAGTTAIGAKIFRWE